MVCNVLLTVIFSGLCPPCSEKLNYRSKKREIKRLKHVEKFKNKERNPNKKKQRDFESQSPEPSTANDDDKESSEKEENVLVESQEEPANVWEGKDKTAEQIVREDEFGKYLEDLLL